MILYVGISIWMFLMLILGIRHDSVIVAECWPKKPEGQVERANNKIVTFLTFATFAFLWFLTAFRSSSIGNDTKTYLYYFNIYTQGIDRSRTFEVGYQYLNYYIGKITTDPHKFIIIMATIMYGGITWYIHKYSKNITVSLCLFFCYFFSMFTSIFRQGIAMIIVLYGYQFLKKNKKIYAGVLFLLASTIHTTALVSFLLFLDAKILKKRWFVITTTGICGLLAITGVLNNLVGIIFPRYVHYLSSRYASSGWLAVTYSLISYALWYILVNRSVDPNNKEERIISTNFTMLLIFAAFGYSVNLFTRAGEYFLLIGVTEIPNMLYKQDTTRNRRWLFCICTALIIMFILTLIFRPGWNHLYPYEFWK